jgi:AraC family transcriptional regulator
VRLSKSTGKLANDLSVTEVAMQSGYETPAAFAKAFKEQYAVSPKEFAKNIKEQKGNAMIDAKIVDFEPTEVLYVRKRGDYMVSAGEAFEVLFGFAYAQKIKYHKNLLGKEAKIFGIGHDDPNITAAEDLRYDACISYDDKTVKPEGEVGIKTIEGGRHLYYPHKGPYEELKRVYSDLMAYIIENGINMADRPLFERYLNRDPRRTKPENLKTEIYIPIEE